MFNFAKKVHALLVEQSDKSKLPIAYRSDISADLDSLLKYERSGAVMEFVWLLRECGTVLFPIRVGASPVHVTHWLDEKNGQIVEAYHLTAVKSLIEPGAIEYQLKPIGWAEASRLANLRPTGNAIDTIKFGCDMGFWSTFSTPSYEDFAGGLPEWRKYFAMSSNQMMVDHIDTTLRKLRAA